MSETDEQSVTEQKSEFKLRQKAKQMPRPQGYKLLIGLIEPDEKTEGGLLKAQQTMDTERTGSNVGYVMALGPDAYKDESKFPTGPWCKQGDFIVMRPYSGTRLLVHGVEMRLINDDSVDAVIDDPRGVARV